MLKLFHDKDLIGTITNEMPDDFAFVGEVSLTEQGTKYKEIFEFFSDQDKRMYVDPPFSDSQLENWFVENEYGERTEISTPAVNDKNEIWWR
jgi:hypothetical protein